MTIYVLKCSEQQVRDVWGRWLQSKPSFAPQDADDVAAAIPSISIKVQNEDYVVCNIRLQHTIWYRGQGVYVAFSFNLAVRGPRSAHLRVPHPSVLPTL